MRKEALDRLQNSGDTSKDDGKDKATPVAYRDPNLYPTSSGSGGSLKTHQTFVDGKQEAVLIPVHGRLVPFHISTIKNVSKSEEGGWTFLRVNFAIPAALSTASLPAESEGASHWVKELTLKAKVPTNLNSTFRLIKELRKRTPQHTLALLDPSTRRSTRRLLSEPKSADCSRTRPPSSHPFPSETGVTQREKEKADLADVVVQEDLQLIRTGKIHRLRDVNVRPSVGGKKAPGTLELHATGLRFLTSRGEKLDLIFKNIKLAFFQPVRRRHRPRPR